MMDLYTTDVLILGGGLAARTAARALRGSNAAVSLLTVSPGASAPADWEAPCPPVPADQLERDTLRAGAYQNDPALVRALCQDAPPPAPAREGEIPHRRGWGLRLFMQGGRVQGALCFDPDQGRLFGVSAGAVLLATGGYGDLYAADGNRRRMGDAIGMAYYAGAAMTDLEFSCFSQDRTVTLGGVIADEQGRATVPGLLAAGGCMAGVHGAGLVPGVDTRAALVFGRRAGLALAGMDRLPGADPEALRAWAEETAPIGDEDLAAPLAAMRREMEAALRAGAGPVRDQTGVEKALQTVSHAQHELNELPPCPEDQCFTRLRLENDLIAARLTLLSSMERRESVGVYRRADHPEAPRRPYRVRLALTGMLLFPEKEDWSGHRPLT